MNESNRPLILASRSPRRSELLREAGYDFTVVAPDDDAEADNEPRDGESPTELVGRLAAQKASGVARRVPKGTIIGCDTIACCDGKILGKPTDIDDARRMLRLLSGRDHQVHSGLCIWRRPEDDHTTRVATTQLRMDTLDDQQIDAYLATGKWSGKAGAFGYQDGWDWLHVVSGSESNVVGLPLELLSEMLSR